MGVVRPGGKIDYAFHLSKPKPDTRTITEAYKNERRYWLRWTDGELKKADDELLERAGIDPQGWLLKFRAARYGGAVGQPRTGESRPGPAKAS